MTKSKAAKRKRQAQTEGSHKLIRTAIATITPPPEDAATSQPLPLASLVDDDELETTVQTLNLLAQHPIVIKTKGCKDLRAAVYDFRQASGVEAGESNITARVTAALADGRLTDARVLLAEMRIRGQTPKLGALCRWVRGLDVVSGLSMQVEGVSHSSVPRPEQEQELLRTLDAVLRVTGPVDASPGALASTEPIALQKTWSLRDSNNVSEDVHSSVADGSILALAPAKQLFRILETIPGPQRKPPNHHAAILYTSSPDAIPIASSPSSSTPSLHTHPNIPDLRLIRHVLSPSECKAVIAAGEQLEFLPDAPVGSEEAQASVLAHNFYWLVDEAFHDALWARVAAHLPAHVGGRAARGLNRRFRVYRYRPGSVYRLHVDGAWPASGVGADGQYVYDTGAASNGRRQQSLFTFLIYLNDEFEGGATTFVVPGCGEGTMNAYPVRPEMGAVAVFPHGEAKGALLHEGTGVCRGAKYVVRTDVLYDVDVERTASPVVPA